MPSAHVDYQRVNHFVMATIKEPTLSPRSSPYVPQKPLAYVSANTQNHSLTVMVDTNNYNPYPLPLYVEAKNGI